MVATVATAALAGLAIAGTTMASTSGGFGFGRHEGTGTPLTTEERTAREAEMKTKLTEKLTTSVTDGKLTDSQKAHILDVQGQIHAKMVAGDRTGADKLREELRTWTTAEKIDASVMPFGGGRGQGLRDGKGPHGPRMSDTK